MVKKSKKNLYIELKEYITDYIKFMDTVNEKRLERAQEELDNLIQEERAFHILRQNLMKMEANGIS